MKTRRHTIKATCTVIGELVRTSDTVCERERPSPVMVLLNLALQLFAHTPMQSTF